MIYFRKFGILQTFLTNVAIQACNVATGIITARLLLPAGRGELAAVILWPSILAGIGIMGLHFSLVREVAAHPEEEADLSRAALGLSLLLAFVAMALGYLLLPRLLPADKQHLLGLSRLYLLWLPLNFLTLTLLALHHGRLRWSPYNLIRLSVVVSYLGFLALIWLLDVRRVSWFVLAFLASNVVTTALTVALGRQHLWKGRWRISLAWRVWRQGLPFFLAGVTFICLTQVDKTLLVSLLSTEMVGYYVAAFTFASAHSSLGYALEITSFAALANEPDKEAQGRYLLQTFRQASLLYATAGMAVALLAPLAIVPIFGAEFRPATGPARILAVGTSLLALGNILSEGLKGRGLVLPGIGGQCLGAALIALAGLLLVPRWGISGLALAFVIGAAGQLTLLIAATSYVFGLKVRGFFGLRMTEVKLLCGRVRTRILPS